MMKKHPLGIYVHIPFCVKKCNYCDFLSAPSTKEVQKCYIDALLKQIQSYKALVKEYEIKTIYFGGGTPSLLEIEEMERVFTEIKESYGLTEECLSEMEITLEANPGTFGIDKLLAYRKLGFNRLSMGVQSMNEKELKLLGRVHTVDEFLENYKLARECGFENINIDLMQALPNQTVESWEDTLKKVISLNPEHISAYSLIIEEGTKFYDWYEGKEELLPDEEIEREIYYRTEEILKKAGYERYEISNYAKLGKESRHNLCYWQGVDYLGLGLGASSLIKGERFSNETNLEKFMMYANDLEKTESCYSKNNLEQINIPHLEENLEQTKMENEPLEKNFNEKIAHNRTNAFDRLKKESHLLTKQEQMEEFMFLGLRVMNGVSKQEFLKRFQLELEDVYGQILETLENEQLLVLENDKIALTKKGIDISNYVFAQFLLD